MKTKHIAIDYYFQIFLSLFASYILTIYNKDGGIFKNFQSLLHIRDFVSCFIISLVVTQYLRYVSARLDQRINWFVQTFRRLAWQLVLGLLVPVAGVFVFEAFFIADYERFIFKRNYVRLDYTFVLMMLAIFSLYLLSTFFYRHSLATDEQTNSGQSTMAEKEVLMVHTSTRSIPVKVNSICYAFILQGCVFIRNKDATTIQSSLQYHDTLKTLESFLDPKSFFRINRQMIVGFSSCKSYKPGKNKTLELILNPAPYPPESKIPKEHERLCIVSEDRAAAFRLWMDR